MSSLQWNFDLTTVLTGFFTYLGTLLFSQAFLILAMIVLILSFLPQLRKMITKIFQSLFKRRRTCGDCVILIFKISEKYKLQEDAISRNILNKKMNYVEQKIEHITLDLLKKYKNWTKSNITKLENYKNIHQEDTDVEYWGFKHTTINALDLVKRNIKMSFLENGFHLMSERDFSNYVKEKTKDLISIYETFILNDYPKNIFITANELFEFLDHDWFEDIMFDVFINAKNIQLVSENNIKELEKKFKEDIDNLFVKK